jgi:nitrogen fixation-related uncharacterized protein
MALLMTLIMLALVATVISLGWGIGSMAHGGQFDDKHSTQFMAARVLFQGLIIVFLLMVFFLAT